MSGERGREILSFEGEIFYGRDDLPFCETAQAKNLLLTELAQGLVHISEEELIGMFPDRLSDCIAGEDLEEVRHCIFADLLFLDVLEETAHQQIH